MLTDVWPSASLNRDLVNYKHDEEDYRGREMWQDPLMICHYLLSWSIPTQFAVVRGWIRRRGLSDWCREHQPDKKLVRESSGGDVWLDVVNGGDVMPPGIRRLHEDG